MYLNEMTDLKNIHCFKKTHCNQIIKKYIIYI